MSGCPNIGVWWWMGFDVDGGIGVSRVGERKGWSTMSTSKENDVTFWTVNPKNVVNSIREIFSLISEKQSLVRY